MHVSTQACFPGLGTCLFRQGSETVWKKNKLSWNVERLSVITLRSGDYCRVLRQRWKRCMQMLWKWRHWTSLAPRGYLWATGWFSCLPFPFLCICRCARLPIFRHVCVRSSYEVLSLRSRDWYMTFCCRTCASSRAEGCNWFVFPSVSHVLHRCNRSSDWYGWLSVARFRFQWISERCWLSLDWVVRARSNTCLMRMISRDTFVPLPWLAFGILSDRTPCAHRCAYHWIYMRPPSPCNRTCAPNGSYVLRLCTCSQVMVCSNLLWSEAAEDLFILCCMPSIWFVSCTTFT